MLRRATALLLPLAVLSLGGPANAGDPAPPGATGRGALERDDARVEATLLVDATAATPGEAFRVGVLFDLDRGWHIYWRNPGQSGLATELAWQIDDATVGPIEWPAPEVFREQSGLLTTYGYADQVLLAQPVTFEPGASGERTLRVEADFLVCEVQCIPGRIVLERTLAVGAQSAPADSDTRGLFERYAARVPVPAEALGLQVDALYSQSAIRPGDVFRAGVAVLACESGASGGSGECDYAPKRGDPAQLFVPDRTPSVALTVTGSRPHPFAEGQIITLEGRARRDDPGGDQRLHGVLAVRGPGWRTQWAEVDLPLPRARAGAEVALLENPWLEPTRRAGASHAASVPLWRAVLLALVGGLILNLMPCVLPVLAIKVFGVAELAHRERREVIESGLAYTAGIGATMLALAVTVVALRSAGTAVGWGFQFQEPLFIATISAVLLVFALNLFGAFEFQIDATGMTQAAERSTGLRRSFFEGLLAVIVATPCSAPFLGTAIGFAFASSTPVIVGIFLAVGLGLASPYLLITWVPGWARWIPRPGAWMLHLRRALGFALIGTIVWLLWVIGRSVGIDGMTGLLAFLVVVAFGVWVFGTFQAARRVGWAYGSAGALALVAISLLVALPLEASDSAAETMLLDTNGARPFEPAAIRAELDAGRPVFVYFTADWCLTCKVNERAVLHDDAVRSELARLEVATFKADWTRRDETIRLELERFGRAGVPMYLLYSPADPHRPVLLPELLTVDGMVEALRRAAPPA